MRVEDLLDRLREYDLLLDTDPKFPSLTGLIVGDTGRGSWRAHPKAHEMYRLACELRAHPDVLTIKLISGKVTLVHRPLWPAIYAIGRACEQWQTAGLSAAAKSLLKKVTAAGCVEASGDAVRELESRLLAQAESFHTDRGPHSKRVQTWDSWARSLRLGKVKVTAAEARTQLEQVVTRLNQQSGANGTLPWQKRTLSGRGRTN